MDGDGLSENDVIRIFQKGFNFSQDGPGNRLVYHLAGCNLRCPWCSNPEGLDFSGAATTLGIDEIVKESLSCRMMFIDGGGVTLTGGEVTCQKDAVTVLLKKLRENGIHTCIETNASLKNCEELFQSVDYMIADFKSPDKEKLKSITGADLDTIKNNLLFRAKTGKPLLIRIPLINGFNNGEENACFFVDFFNNLKAESGNENLFFEILTYHEYGKEKYEKLGKEYTVNNGFVSPEDVRLLATEIKIKNLKLIHT
ncbi:MAG: radical SAM protein [Ruminococcaceae bacterium]|nr:radical SAM protein [Oscillospiraceae bacterium]